MTRTGADGNVVVDEDVFEHILTGGTFPGDLQERVRSEARTHLRERVGVHDRGTFFSLPQG